MSNESRSLPEQLHGPHKGNHDSAIAITKKIQRYVDEAVQLLEEAKKVEHGAFLRAGFLRQGDDQLDSIMRYAETARKELRFAYSSDLDDQ